MGKICEVNDGQCRWRAPLDTLREALELLDWEQQGRTWCEPEGEPEPPESHYESLCRWLEDDVIPDGDEDDEPDATFEWREDLGGVWLLDVR